MFFSWLAQFTMVHRSMHTGRAAAAYKFTVVSRSIHTGLPTNQTFA